MDLRTFGWDERWAATLAALDNPKLEIGRITAQFTGIFRAATTHGEILARVTGSFRHRHRESQLTPVIGDWVALLVPPDGGQGAIHALLPRRTVLVRKAAGRSAKEQVIAANVQRAFLMTGLDGDYNLRRIERYLLVAAENDVTPVIVLNKMDLCPASGKRVAEVERIAGGIPVLSISALTGESIDQLRAFLAPGETVVLLGSSGAGKSTLINQLFGRARQTVREVREWDQRGRHTTVNRELFVLPCGALIIDTPGLRELQPWETGRKSADTFADVEQFTIHCRFADCQHGTELGCAVREAIARGELSEERLKSYLKLTDESQALTSHRERLSRRGSRQRIPTGGQKQK